MQSHLQKLPRMAANLRRDDDDKRQETTRDDERRRREASHANTAPTPRPPTINGNPSLRIREKYIHTYIHTSIHPYIHTSIHPYIHPYIHTSIRAYVHTCIHAYTHTCIHAYTHTCIHSHMHTCIHTYIHQDISQLKPVPYKTGYRQVQPLEPCLEILKGTGTPFARNKGAQDLRHLYNENYLTGTPTSGTP